MPRYSMCWWRVGQPPSQKVLDDNQDAKSLFTRYTIRWHDTSVWRSFQIVVLSFVSDLLIATRDARSETRTACSSHCNLTPTCWVAIRWWGCRNHFPKIIITKSNQIKSNVLLRDEGFCLSNKMTKIADLPALINVDGAGRRMALRSFGSRHVGLFV